MILNLFNINPGNNCNAVVVTNDLFVCYFCIENSFYLKGQIIVGFFMQDDIIRTWWWRYVAKSIDMTFDR